MSGHFDETRPYGTVYEMPGVRYQQNGQYFRSDGTPVANAVEPHAAREDLPESYPRTGSDDLRLADNKRLKAQLDIYGEEWRGAAAARRFLEGKGV